MRGTKVNGLKIRIAMGKKCFTNEMLAEAAGVGTNTVARAKRGEHVDDTTIVCIAEALDMPPESLVEVE
jgi:hypothetical protein